MRRAVLGIDAAWTIAQPSGVALAVETASGWRLAAVESSYQRFVALAEGTAPNDARPVGSSAVASSLLDATSRIGGVKVDLIAVDMPLGPEPIVGRRKCDDEISRKYGRRKAAVHSPSGKRPGNVSDAFRESFGALGYPVCLAAPAVHGLIEVYPHAALIEFMNACERLRYKAAKSLTYWPGLPRAERQVKLRETWRRIIEAMDESDRGNGRRASDP